MRKKLGELRDVGKSLKDSREEIAVMQPAELGLRKLAVLDDIRVAVERYAVDHVREDVPLQLRVRLKLTHSEATLAEWWLEAATP